MSQATVVTASGKYFDILDTAPEMVCLYDIAHALSQGSRFTGHCRFPYPVAQHSRLGSYLVPPVYALRFLLHDASEAYLGDMNRPLKHFTLAGQEYRKVEARIQGLIYEKFGLQPEDPEVIHEFDNQMLYAEKAQIMPATEWQNKWSKDEKAADVVIHETSFRDNRDMFLDRFYDILQHEGPQL
jgi:5'-deoxynucleotidase YfbR-like HD superfamily hydrolase